MGGGDRRRARGRARGDLGSHQSPARRARASESQRSAGVGDAGDAMNTEHREYRTLSSLSIRRPVGTLCVTSVIVVLGVFYLGRLRLDLLPQIVYPQVRASVNYPGVAPEVMEEQVTKVLETALATTENVVRIETETQEGRASVDLYFEYGTDVNFALQDASKNVDRA